LLAGALLGAIAIAHQPRFPSPDTTRVKNPDISQAYYAELKGVPDQYIVDSKDSLLLYVQLVVPDIPNIKKDYVFDIFARTDSADFPLGQLRGDQAKWTEFFDPFGGDNYFQGPEFESPVPPGSYRVAVSSPDNAGKYLMVVGRKESFPLGEIVRTVGVLPGLKRNYFGKPAASAFWNYTGLMLGGTAAVLAGIIVGAVLLARR
jgi:hypothetical protein